MKRLFTHPAFAVATIALVLITGGTTYAITDGFTKAPNFSQIFGYKETTDLDGSKVIAISTSNCGTAKQVTAEEAKTGGYTVFFKVRDTAGITNDDALRYVQGFCEFSNVSKGSAMTDGEINALSLNARFYYDSIVKYITVLERVAPCGANGNEFCPYTATTSSTNAGNTSDPLAVKAREFVKRAYETYASQLFSGEIEPGSDPMSKVNALHQQFYQNTTADLAKNLDRNDAADTILCSQSEIMIDVGTATKQPNGTYVVAVQGKFEGMEKQSLADVTYDASLDKMTAISCAHL